MRRPTAPAVSLIQQRRTAAARLTLYIMVNIATALVASVLLAAVHDARAVETWVAATDARVQVVGRYRAETTDGSVSFDWEGVYALVNVQGAT